MHILYAPTENLQQRVVTQKRHRRPTADAGATAACAPNTKTEKKTRRRYNKKTNYKKVRGYRPLDP